MQVTLQEILEARETRVRVQREMLHKHHAPLLCFTMNIAGPTKTSALIERAFSVGLDRIEAALGGDTVVERRESRGKCGPEAFWAVSAEPHALKTRMVEIEESHPLGRLFDIDVMDTNGEKLNRPHERGCLLCGAPGRACAAGRLHPVAELIAHTDRMIRSYFTDLDAARVARIAKESLLREVYTAPKPGLVDPTSRGSHTDMDVATFEQSAEALEPYFYECVRAGANAREATSPPLFPRLRTLGMEAEKRMYAATKGVNTHKGVIFSMGILAGAVGQLLRPDGTLPSTEEILAQAAALSHTAIKQDLTTLDGSTAGGRAYLAHGERGVRGEVLEGFPTLRSIALPTYKSARAEGKNQSDAGVLTLLHLMANIFDTNLYKRGGEAGVTYVRDYARALLASPLAPERLYRMDADLTERNLSPGGSADLLALTYFLTALEQ